MAAKYLHDMSVFQKGKHDDQVDSTAQFSIGPKSQCSACGVVWADAVHRDVFDRGLRDLDLPHG
jgi:hypothetical protein